MFSMHTSVTIVFSFVFISNMVTQLSLVYSGKLTAQHDHFVHACAYRMRVFFPYDKRGGVNCGEVLSRVRLVAGGKRVPRLPAAIN